MTNWEVFVIMTMWGYYTPKAQKMDRSPNNFERREYNELCN